MMSLIFALEAAVNGPTGPRAILFDGLGRTKRRRRQSRQRPTPGILTPHRRPRAATGTFRKISRSIRSFAFSSRNRASSSRSSPLSPPGRSPFAAFSSFSQFLSVTLEIPKSLASRRCGLSPS